MGSFEPLIVKKLICSSLYSVFYARALASSFNEVSGVNGI